MPGSCEADKSSSNLISTLRSYRLKDRPKYQIPSQSSSSVPPKSPPEENILKVIKSSIPEETTDSNSIEDNSYQNSSDNSSNLTTPVVLNNVTQSYNPLSYRKYEVSQFVLPCVLTKVQQTLRKSSSSVLELQINLSEEEYIKLKELVLKDVRLSEKWKCSVIESTSYVTSGSRELKISRQYVTELRKLLQRTLANPTSIGEGSSADSLSELTALSNSPRPPIRTYSRPSKTPKKEVSKAEIQSEPSIDCTKSHSPTKGIMDEYEVFCEKEQNLRKLLDRFPGADIMEAQDILVKCNWDLEKAVQIAHSQPLRCSKKKAQQYVNSKMSSQSSVESDAAVQSVNDSNTGNGHKIPEEIVLDSSDDEQFNNLMHMVNNKRRNETSQLPVSKRVRKMLSSSDSEDDLNSVSANHLNVSLTEKTVNSVNKNKSVPVIKPVTVKMVPSASDQTSSSASSMPNLPKGLVITQLGSASTTLVPNNVSNNKNVNMVNKKAEVISIPTQSLSTTLISTKPPQLVRIQPSNNAVTSTVSKSAYSIHKTNSSNSVSKDLNISPVNSSIVVSTSKNQNETSDPVERERICIKIKSVKSKHRKKYVPSDDEDEEYGNEDIYNSEDSDIEENLTSAHAAVLKFFQEASVEELSSIPGCSKKKVDLIQNLRPFSNWMDLVQKLSNDKYLSPDLLNGAKKVLDMRNAINKLMAKCQQISLDMEDLVENLKENRECSSDYVAKQPELLNDNMHLAPYQMLGLNWLLLLHNQEVNGILADEMGLGKTIQAVAFLAYLKQININGPHLIVVPSSTLDNWKHELQLWWPSVSILVYHGSQESRRELRLQILNDEVEDFDVMVTTYNMVTSSSEDRSFFKRLEFHYVVFDEAHMLKNMSSQRYQHLMRIKAPRRLLLTGTPLQNNLVELMSLLIFAMPHMFSGKTEQIKQMFTSVSKTDGNKNSYEKDRINHAKRIMKPFVLRRLKREVLKDLPVKIDETRRVPMIESQAEKYNKLVEKFSAEVRNNKEDSSEKISSSGAGMMMQLRRAANHPLLLRHFYDEEKLMKMSHEILKEPTHTEADPNLVFEDMFVMSDFELFKLCKNFKSLESFILPEKYVLDSGKFRVLDELLPKLIEEDHRILLFSQFTMVLDIIEEYMHIKNYKYMRLDGQTPVSERQVMIDEFNNDPTISIFLLSTRAGGLGINLTAADTVILHDIDFNPYNDKQAEDRCHRVGQIRDVKVVRFISENTIEEGILQSAKEKLKLEKDIHDEAGSETEENDSASVAKLLRDALGLKNSKS